MSAHMQILRLIWFYPGYGRLGDGGSRLGVLDGCTYISALIFCDVWCVINCAVNGHLHVCSTKYFILKQI